MIPGNDIIGYATSTIEARQLKSGRWRAYMVYETTPGNRNNNYGYSQEVVKDLNWNIITGSSRADLVFQLKKEYPGWKWGMNAEKERYKIE